MLEGHAQEMKEYMEQTLQSIEGKKEAVQEVVRTAFPKLLCASRQVGESLESLTYEVLEGIEEGLDDTVGEEHLQAYLHYAAEEMLEIIHLEALHQISAEHKKMHLAQKHFEETLALEKSHLEESVEAFKHYASEKIHSDLLEKLDATEVKIEEKLHQLLDEFQYNKQKYREKITG